MVLDMKTLLYTKYIFVFEKLQSCCSLNKILILVTTRSYISDFRLDCLKKFIQHLESLWNIDKCQGYRIYRNFYRNQSAPGLPTNRGWGQGSSSLLQVLPIAAHRRHVPSWWRTPNLCQSWWCSDGPTYILIPRRLIEIKTFFGWQLAGRISKSQKSARHPCGCLPCMYWCNHEGLIASPLWWWWWWWWSW